MSTTVETAAVGSEAARGSWALWSHQLGAILRIELRRNFLSMRAALMYVLAALPIVLLFAMAVFPPTARHLAEPGTGTTIFAYIYEGLILRAVVFFGCAWIFMNLFRGEIVDRSLHYYLLAAVRREVLVAGKYISGLIAAVVFFGGATLACLILFYVPRGPSATIDDLAHGSGLAHAAGYLFVTVLACVGYGAVFLAIGLLFRNPIFPALAIYGWEFINFLLPPVLKKISIIHYLQSLSPVPVSEGPFAVLADPTPAWIAVPGFFITTALVLAFAGWRARRLEIRYGGE
jgi:ABC-type transport system involved in multi-copper enzyme maturation permease subunit